MKRTLLVVITSFISACSSRSAPPPKVVFCIVVEHHDLDASPISTKFALWDDGKCVFAQDAVESDPYLGHTWSSTAGKGSRLQAGRMQHGRLESFLHFVQEEANKANLSNGMNLGVPSSTCIVVRWNVNRTSTEVSFGSDAKVPFEPNNSTPVVKFYREIWKWAIMNVQETGSLVSDNELVRRSVRDIPGAEFEFEGVMSKEK